ncbi:DNA polymerase V subunit UmuC, partial [Acinetobacter baumannii]
MKRRIFALVDVNNCYASIERFFNPQLNNRPVIVLSNNDGCAVARSAEAKAIGIKMGEPLFKIIDLVKRNNVAVLSSNYPVYAEMSKRFHSILKQFVAPHEHETYSIDEAFLELTAYQQNYDLDAYARLMKNRIWQWIGLPVCVGIGRSKTEAKMANHLAKTYPTFDGVCNLVSFPTNIRDLLYKQTSVSEVWGVGRQHSKKLESMGITKVYDLMMSNPYHMETLFSVVMKRTVLELNGIACIEIEDTPPSRKQIISSRAFKQKIIEKDDLKEAIARRTQEAFIRARKDQVLCGCIIAFAHSSPFDVSKPFYKGELSQSFSVPTDDVRRLVKASTSMIENIYRYGVDFKKCGVVLTALESKNSYTYDLLTDYRDLEKTENLMCAIENIQTKYGKYKLGFGGSMYQNRAWSMSQNLKSNNYFTLEGM